MRNLPSAISCDVYSTRSSFTAGSLSGDSGLLLFLIMAIPFPALPTPPSWFPGHMNRFTKQLPALLSRTDVVLELRDSRLPLTSINHNLERESRVFFLRLRSFGSTLSLPSDTRNGCFSLPPSHAVVPMLG